MRANKLSIYLVCGFAALLAARAQADGAKTDADPAGAARYSVEQAKLNGEKEAAKAEAKAKRDALRARSKARTDAFWADRDRERVMRDAQRVLEQSMRQARDQNVTAIVTRIGDCMQKLKIEQDALGNQLSTVLQPLSMQGTTLFNSGSKSFTYWPDQRIVVECDSDAENMDDIEERAELAAKNYDLKVAEAGEEIAGRPTVCVTAEPRVPGLPARQFYLDMQTLYPLRMTQQTDGGWKVNMDTIVVNFPKEMPDINLNLVGTPRKVKFAPAIALSCVRNPKDRLGFNPVIPSNLPYGFRVQRAELRRNEDGQLAMLWLTDGLATARVYEFRCNQLPEGIWSRGTNTVLTEDGVTMMLVSDLRADTRRGLLRAFAKRTPEQIAPPSNGSVPFPGRSTPMPNSEPAEPKPMFTFPKPQSGTNNGEPDDGSADSNAIGQANNVKGD